MTQKTIFLHIGRHKTGTSSIQKFLNSNKDLLYDQNLYYPECGKKNIAHHDLAQLFAIQSNNTPEDQAVTADSCMLQELKQEIDQQSADILISSENFQNAHPVVIQRAFKNYDFQVLVYIRNEIDYLASSYAQKVWATNYARSMEQFYHQSFNVDYLEFLNVWQESSNGHIKVRKFAKDALHDKDIIADFFVNMLNVRNDAVDEKIRNREVTDANPSLTSELLAYKLKYNSSAFSFDELTQKRFRQALAGLSLKKEGAPVRVTPQLKEICSKIYPGINKQVSQKYFDNQELFSMNRPTGIPSILNREKFIDISNKLSEIDPRISAQISEFTNEIHLTLPPGEHE